MDVEVENEGQNRRRIRSIEVGFRVIKAMLLAERPMPLRDLAAEAGMAPSKAHLYLASFVREGMARQDPETGHYGLGQFAVELGLSAIQRLSIVEESRTFLLDLANSTGCGVYLSLLSERGPSIVSKSDGFRNGALSVRLGYVLPVTETATGHVFLAHLPAQQCVAILDREYARPEQARHPDFLPRSKLEAYLPKISKQGYATTHGNVNANFVAIASPVFDHTGGIAGVLTILGPDKYLRGQEHEASIKSLTAAAAQLSKRMGAAPGA